MDFSRLIVVCVFGLLIGACGGGGGATSSPGPSGSAPPPPPPEPTVHVTVTTASLDLELAEGDEFPVDVAGSWSATDLPAGSSLYLEIRDAAQRFQVLAPQLVSASAFTLKLKTSGVIAPGSYDGSLVVRACRDAACAQTYAGTGGSLNYAMHVSGVTDWQTHQRDSAHRGYVPIWLDASRFSRAWDWSRPQDGEPIGGINAVVTRDGAVYVSTDVYFGGGVLAALREADGTEAWRVALGTVPALGPPAVSEDTVFVATTGHQDTFLWAFDAATGAFRRKSPFGGQWPHTLAPTVFGDRAYVGAGYYGGTLYSFSTSDGSQSWNYVSGGAWDMFTPAVDENFAYHYDGGVLHLIDRDTGAAGGTIVDPFGVPASHSYHGSPMIGNRTNVVTFARGAFSGLASSNAEQFEQRVLSSFDTSTRKYEWSTPHTYLTAPAVAHGYIYAGRNSPMSLDAIDEATGQIVWSWTPSGQGDSSFHRNVIVTRNLLFVSTDIAVYAVDLQTREVEWRYDEPGMLAISADRTLYVATGATKSDGKVVAIRLR